MDRNFSLICNTKHGKSTQILERTKQIPSRRWSRRRWTWWWEEEEEPWRRWPRRRARSLAACPPVSHRRRRLLAVRRPPRWSRRRRTRTWRRPPRASTASGGAQRAPPRRSAGAAARQPQRRKRAVVIARARRVGVAALAGCLLTGDAPALRSWLLRVVRNRGGEEVERRRVFWREMPAASLSALALSPSGYCGARALHRCLHLPRVFAGDARTRHIAVMRERH